MAASSGNLAMGLEEVPTHEAAGLAATKVWKHLIERLPKLAEMQNHLDLGVDIKFLFCSPINCC
jgi:hypothetical protein